MAFLLPENLASRSDVPQAVRDLASALRDLVDDDVTVWLEDDEQGPFLVVFDPKQGVCLIHVVEGGIRSLQRDKGLIRKMTKPVDWEDLVGHLGPERDAITRRIAQSPYLANSVPVAITAAVPSADIDAARRVGYADTDHLLLKEDFRPGALREALGRIISSPGTALSEPEERAVRATIYPELVIRDDQTDDDQVLFGRPEDEDTLAVLDREQERLARHLGDGYRVVKGVAGSGKTLVLAFRAKFLAEHFPEQRFLLTCYNKVLADALKLTLDSVPNVDVATVDSLAAQVCRAAGRRIDGSGDERFRLQRAEALKAMMNGSPSGFVYDAVLLDEAQDLDDVGTELAHAFLAPGRDQFVIALDAAQNIYRRQSRWTPAGTSGRGRTKVLRLNYRNTREILEVAYKFLLAGASTESLEAEIDDPHVIVPPESSARRGERPRMLQCGSAKDALNVICEDIVKAHTAGTAWSEMAVLVGNPWVRRQLFGVMKGHSIPYFDVSYSRNKSKVNESGDTVKGATIQALKGLEYRRVYLAGVDDVQAGKGADDETKRRLVYVGMTRATDHLMVAIHGKGPVVADLLAAAGG